MTTTTDKIWEHAEAFMLAHGGPLLGLADWTAEEVLLMGEDRQSAYQQFLNSRRFVSPDAGFQVDELNPSLMDWQAVVVRWALRKGRAAIWAGCGLGKTLMQLEWAHRVCAHTCGSVLLLAPLAVAEQTRREGEKFGIAAKVVRHQSEVVPGINITNYEMIHEFNTAHFIGVVLDESSLLKSHDGKTRQMLTDSFAQTPYRLCCSATPAPNDHMELATHAEFLGTMKRAEMLSMFFVHDGGDTAKWRIKKHAINDFWRWICSWAVMLRKPSDIGFDDAMFTLPPMTRKQITVPSEWTPGTLFPVEAKTMNERRGARRDSLERRVAEAAHLANVVHKDEPILVWCDLNAESVALADAIPDAVEVTGADSNAVKSNTMHSFTEGRIRVLVSKPTLCGFGMNWQHCAVMIFVGLSDSFEQVYQAERRCWRFGQTRPVTSYMITSEAEGAVVRNQERKLADFDLMGARMVEFMQEEMERELGVIAEARLPYSPRINMALPNWIKEIAA